MEASTVDNTSVKEAFDRISSNGISVDFDGVVKKIQELKAEESEEMERLAELTDYRAVRDAHPDAFSKKDTTFNPRSKKHINAYIVHHGGDEVHSVSEANLETKVPQEVFDQIMKTRRLRKFSGDLQTLRDHLSLDSRIHVSWTEAKTGRWYTGKPPIQTMAKVCREYLVPDEGNQFVVMDWRQQELRLLAHLSQDPGLLEAFSNDDNDPHIMAYQSVTKQQPSQDALIFKQQRDLGKMLNYALIYGLDAQGLGQRLRIANDQAQQLIDKYFEAYPVLSEWRQGQAQKVQDEGHVETLGGRQLEVVPDPNRRDANDQVARKAVNYLVQGSAADQLMAALVRMTDGDNTENAPLIEHVRATIHDAFLLETDQADTNEVVVRAKYVMEDSIFGIASPVDVKGPADSWLKAMEFVEEEDKP